MHAIVAELLNRALTSFVEVSVEHVVRTALEPGAHDAPEAEIAENVDPVDEAIGTMDGFLRALAASDAEAVVSWCHLPWVQEPENADLLDQTLAAAPPISWAFTEVLAPDDYTPGAWAPWFVAELAVTFDVGDRYEIIPAVLRAIYTEEEGWVVDFLWWGDVAAPESEVEPQPEWGSEVSMDDLLAGFGEEITEWGAVPANVVIECARCGQNLSVPSDKGRLRVSCPKCSNVQWYVP